MMNISGLKFIRRVQPDGRSHFIVNHAVTAFDGWLPLAHPAAALLAMNPMTGAIGALEARPAANGGTEVKLRIEPGHSIILRSFQHPVSGVAAYAQNRPGRELQQISTPWQVRFLAGGPELPAAYETASPAPWTGRGDPQADAFSGTAVYQTTFDATKMPTAETPLLLDLGEVSQIARVRLNGKDLGAILMPPFRVPLTADVLKPNKNTLEVEVTNTGANRLRDLDRRKVPWRIFNDVNFVSITYKPMDTSKWPVQSSGLLGPVRIVACDQ
jgi:hypothetical protein